MPASAWSGIPWWHTKKALREKVREVIRSYKQPALVQGFLPGREFNVGILGGRKLRVLPLAEVDYSRLPAGIPPIMSYAAKWVETSVEFKRTRVICPAKVEPQLATLIGDTAVKAFRAVGGWGYGRVDIRTRRGRAAPRPRGQLQSLPRQGDRAGPFGGAGGDQLSRAAADGDQGGLRRAAVRHPPADLHHQAQGGEAADAGPASAGQAAGIGVVQRQGDGQRNDIHDALPFLPGPVGKFHGVGADLQLAQDGRRFPLAQLRPEDHALEQARVELAEQAEAGRSSAPRAGGKTSRSRSST